MDSRVSVERLWFSNTLLLGFDVAFNEKKYRISFSYDMFKNPNVKGMEVIIHFLLSQIHPKRFSESLKFSWPINDQSQAKQFKQVVVSHLQELRDKEKLDLPPIESILQTCSGKRFYDLLWKVSQHALQNAMQKEFSNYEMPHLSVVDNSMSLSRLLDVITATKLHIARQSKIFVSHAQKVVGAQENWKQFDKRLYDEHMSLSEELAFVNKELAELSSKVDLSKLNNAEAQENRAKRIEDVRKTWKVVEEFDASVTKNQETYDDILSGKAYRHQLNATDLHIDKVPDELAAVAGPLLLPSSSSSSSTSNSPQFNFDGLITLYTAAISTLSRQLPPSSSLLPIHNDAPKLALLAKSQIQQQAAIEAFESELMSQVVSRKKELQEGVSVHDSIDTALHNRSDDRFRMQALPPPAVYVDSHYPEGKKELSPKEFGFSSPASRAPKQDVLEKLAKSVKRVALRGSRTFAAMENELFAASPVHNDSQNLSISTMSSIDPDTLFAPPATPASGAKRRGNTTVSHSNGSRNPRPSIMDTVYKRPTNTFHSTTKPKATKPPLPTKPSSSDTFTKLHSSKDGSALNLGSVFQHNNNNNNNNKVEPNTARKHPSTKPTPSNLSISSTPTIPTSQTKKTTTNKKTQPTKPHPTAMDLLVEDLASYIAEGGNDGDYDDYPDTQITNVNTTSKPKPGGLLKPHGQRKSPKKKLVWAENSDELHSRTQPLDAMEDTAFRTTKQLPRTPLPHERSNKPQKHTPRATREPSSPSNFFGDNSTSLYSDDLEWSQFMNTTDSADNKPSSHSPNGKTNNKRTPKKTPRTKRNASNDEMITEAMDFDVVGSPMHMSDWLSNNSSTAPLDDDTDTLFPSFSSNLSFSNENNKTTSKPKPFISQTPKKINYNSLFSTPSDEPWE